MNWIIKNTQKLKFHTNLGELLQPIKNDLTEYDWIVADIEVNTSQLTTIPINNQDEWFRLTFSEMTTLMQADAQIIWGAFSAIPEDYEFDVKRMDLPFAEGVDVIWKCGNLQIPNSLIEIIAWDSSYTIVKFTDQQLSDKFKDHFNEAIALEKYDWSNKKANISAPSHIRGR